MKKIGALEIFLIEVILYMALWLSNDYLAVLLSSILGTICFFLLIIAWVSELLEPTRVPRWYFHLMLISVIAPLVVAGVFLLMIK